MILITSKIYNLFNEEYYLKYTEFFPLTKSTLKEIVTNEEKIPVILHLICKSTYILEEKNDDFAYLIFEKDYDFNDKKNNYNVDFIGKKTLKDEIFNFKENPELKNIIKKITLIISTPLAEDAYDIFKDFGFKNIIIQHTTLADVNFIANFNKNFYKIMITHLSQPINTIFKQALYEAIVDDKIDKENLTTFCCCLHKHKENCILIQNLKNEFYNNNYSKNIEELKSKEKIFNEIEKVIPHFYHLVPKCPPKQVCSKAIEKINLNSVEIYPENLLVFTENFVLIEIIISKIS